jgi:hypothetical protein
MSDLVPLDFLPLAPVALFAILCAFAISRRPVNHDAPRRHYEHATATARTRVHGEKT